MSVSPREVTLQPQRCRTLLNRVQGDTMPFRWTINPYRGCQHACPYCYARPTHGYLGFDDPKDFDRRILVKENAGERLREDLRRWRPGDGAVAIGTASDPYQPGEAGCRLMRPILEALIEFRIPATITTKSALILRDIDLLQELERVAGCAVNCSLASLDGKLAKHFEPFAAHPARRLHVVRILHRNGIPAGLFLAPLLPGLSDTEESLRRVLHAAAAAGAAFATPSLLRLGDGVREWFLQALEGYRPHLLPLYRHLYRKGASVHAPYAARVYERFERLCADAGLSRKHPLESRGAQGPATLSDRSPRPARAPEARAQLALPI